MHIDKTDKPVNTRDNGEVIKVIKTWVGCRLSPLTVVIVLLSMTIVLWCRWQIRESKKAANGGSVAKNGCAHALMCTTI